MDHSSVTQKIIYCLRMDSWKAEIPAGMGKLSNEEWQEILQESTRHQISPLLYLRLRERASTLTVPDWVKKEFRLRYLQNAKRNMELYLELRKVLQGFCRKDIPVMALKGVYLAENIYGNIALRMMDDVDLLVKEKDLKKTEEVLVKLGYVPLLIPKQKSQIISPHHHHFIYRLDRGVSLEIHWGLIGSRFSLNVEMDGQWERAKPCLVGGVEIFCQCPEDLLLHLCLHLTRDLFEQIKLKHLWDIFELIRLHGDEIHWDELVARSRVWGMEKSLFLILGLASEITGAAVPEDLLRQFGSIQGYEKFLERAKGQISPRPLGTGSSHFTLNMARIWGGGKRRDRAALFFKRVFPSPREMRRLYPEAAGTRWIYCYYPVRLKDLLAGHSRQVWHLVRRDKNMERLAEDKNKLFPLKEWLGWPE
ncbi:MAG TPA: nucleotidyltransferase family protein [Thermodesulfobacteriota bacterium]|nr:nucleotidyltransferase family protein [Thermodesulfobacteriota bacterium]